MSCPDPDCIGAPAAPACQCAPPRTAIEQRNANYRALRHELGDRALAALQAEVTRPKSVIRGRCLTALLAPYTEEQAA